jgi:hypothetical protein
MRKSQSLNVARPVAFEALATMFAAAVETAPEVDLETGFDIAVDWGSVEGMNDVRVDAASLEITRMIDVAPAPAPWNFTKSGDGFDVTVTGAKRVRSLTLEGLPGLKDPLDFKKDLLIVVSLPGGPPLYTAPAVGPNGVIPATFTGASIDGGVLTLPDLAATTVHLALVNQSFPTDASAVPMTLTNVSGRGSALTSDLALTEDGVTLWSIPGDMPAATTTVDLRFFIEKTLKAKAKAGQPLVTSFRLTGKGKAGVVLRRENGAVIRRISGILTTELAGEPVTLPIPVPPPLAAEVPSRVIGDVTIAYHGMRLEWRDDVPLKEGGIEGVVAGEIAVTRKLPPQAFIGLALAKIGIIGRAPVDCELVVQVLDANSDAVLLQPPAAALTASLKTGLVWFDMPAHDVLEQPLAIAVRANHGRFLWAARPDPLLRVTVYDDDPGNLPVLIGGSDTRQKTLSGSQFASKAPSVVSDLFATVDVSDLTLEYGR